MPPPNSERVSPSQLRGIILDQVKAVADQHNRVLGPLTDDLLLIDSGLDSLCIAVLVACLDDELDLDPFSKSDSVAFPVTLGDFIRLYEHAAES